MSGPYESEAEAREAALKRPGPARPGWSILSEAQNRQLLLDACEQAGVELGEFDRKIVSWLAGFEDSTCAVVAGLITRASRLQACRPMCTDDLDPETGEAFGVDPLGEAG